MDFKMLIAAFVIVVLGVYVGEMWAVNSLEKKRKYEEYLAAQQPTTAPIVQ